jgi:hypothetical protein
MKTKKMMILKMDQIQKEEKEELVVVGLLLF